VGRSGASEPVAFIPLSANINSTEWTLEFWVSVGAISTGKTYCIFFWAQDSQNYLLVDASTSDGSTYYVSLQIVAGNQTVHQSLYFLTN
jgi:hypothetical protein